MKYYKESIEYLLKNKVVIFLVLLSALILFPLKISPLVTGLAAMFLAIFLNGGFLGLVRDEKKIERVGIKILVLEGAYYFPTIIINMLNTLLLAIFNFLVVVFFGILPIIIISATSGQAIIPSNSYSRIMLAIMGIMVLIYRLPLFVLAYFVSVENRKISGKEGMKRSKAILWANPKIWMTILLQFAFYSLILMVKRGLVFNINNTQFLIDIGLNILGTFVFVIFLIADFYCYADIVNENDGKKVYLSKENLKRFEGFNGKFII